MARETPRRFLRRGPDRPVASMRPGRFGPGDPKSPSWPRVFWPGSFNEARALWPGRPDLRQANFVDATLSFNEARALWPGRLPKIRDGYFNVGLLLQ